MQIANWNDLRLLLAVKRRQRLAEAARSLAVDATTVSRRLAAAQKAAGRRLYRRLPDGRLSLTDEGEALAAIAERIERDVAALDDGASSGAGAAGVVRLTAVPFLVNRVLAPAAGQLFADHRNLRLELIAEPRDLSLTRRETDMALRLARPRVGGLQVKARRLAVLSYAAYAAAASKSEARTWITYDESMAQLPQARWMAAAIKRGDGRASALRVNDVEAALEAVATGLGRSMLPRCVADRDPRLRRLPLDPEPSWTRELWLLVHAELADLPRSRAVAGWIEEILGAASEHRRDGAGD